MTVFRWLVHSNSLSCLEEQCDALRSVVQRVYRLVLPLDVPEILDYSGTLKTPNLVFTISKMLMPTITMPSSRCFSW